jgi:hypothetical protein
LLSSLSRKEETTYERHRERLNGNLQTITAERSTQGRERERDEDTRAEEGRGSLERRGSRRKGYNARPGDEEWREGRGHIAATEKGEERWKGREKVLLGERERFDAFVGEELAKTTDDCSRRSASALFAERERKERKRSAPAGGKALASANLNTSAALTVSPAFNSHRIIASYVLGSRYVGASTEVGEEAVRWWCFEWRSMGWFPREATPEGGSDMAVKMARAEEKRDCEV